MLGGGKIKLDKDLLDRVKRISDKAGYATVEEFITHMIERELKQFEDAESDDEVTKRLKGLGYIS